MAKNSIKAHLDYAETLAAGTADQGNALLVLSECAIASNLLEIRKQRKLDRLEILLKGILEAMGAKVIELPKGTIACPTCRGEGCPSCNEVGYVQAPDPAGKPDPPPTNEGEAPTATDGDSEAIHADPQS